MKQPAILATGHPDDAVADGAEQALAHMERLTVQEDDYCTFINGRAALMTAKVDQALAHYADLSPVGAVVMSDINGQTANTMTDPSDRDNAIKDHTRALFVRAIDQATISPNDPPVLEIIERLRTIQSQMSIFQILQPDPKRLRNDPLQEITRCVRYIDTRTADSVQRLTAAI